MPLHMRLPKLKGFKNRFRVEYQVVNLDRLAELFPEGGTVGVGRPRRGRRGPRGQPVKVLGTGDLGGVRLDVTRTRSPQPPGEDHRRRGHASPSCPDAVGRCAGR